MSRSQGHRTKRNHVGDAFPVSIRSIDEKERILSLDVLRGFALYGVFIVNAAVSARPFAEAIAAPLDGPRTELLAWAILNGVFVTKFVAIFSLLFGMGLVLQCDRIAAKDESAKIYRRRLGWLALFGVLHGCLLFEGDILLPYAVIGAVLFLLRERSTRFWLACAVCAYAVGLALEAFVATLPFPEDPALDEVIQRAHDAGPLSLLIRVRVTEYLGWLFVSSITMFNWQVLSLFFVGAAVMRHGLLAPRHSGLHKRVALLGWLIGTSLELAALFLHGEEPSPWNDALGAIAFSLGCVFLAGGYVGTVLWIVRVGRLPRLQRALAAVGRTALSNYLAQSVLMNVLFYWFGLGLYESVSRMGVLALVSTLFALQMLLSLWWLRRFRMGPAERLWRRLTYRTAA